MLVYEYDCICIGYYPGKRVTSVLLHEEWMYARGEAEGNIPLRGQQN